MAVSVVGVSQPSEQQGCEGGHVAQWSTAGRDGYKPLEACFSLLAVQARYAGGPPWMCLALTYHACRDKRLLVSKESSGCNVVCVAPQGRRDGLAQGRSVIGALGDACSGQRLLTWLP